MDEELENLKRKKLRELQEQQLAQSLEEQEAQKIEFDEQKRTILRTILTQDAKERLGRIKVARPEIAEAVENQLILLAQRGGLKTKINVHMCSEGEKGSGSFFPRRDRRTVKKYLQDMT